MNKKMYSISLDCGLVLIFGTAFGSIAKESQRYVPEHIIYRTLFHTIFLLNEKVNAKAQAIIQVCRAHYPNGRLRPGQQMLPPSTELAALQPERDAPILYYRNP